MSYYELSLIFIFHLVSTEGNEFVRAHSSNATFLLLLIAEDCNRVSNVFYYTQTFESSVGKVEA